VSLNPQFLMGFVPSGNLDLVRVRREGKFTIYYIADEHVRTLIEMCLEHVEEKA